ncbi:MAG: flavin reductase family protein [Dehalococcoidales bacterium]|nr:flavin reductase family protein [Dehalococcoidales bacterium]
MGKIQMGPQTLLYPMPAMLIGADVDGEPSFMVCAWCGIANSEPPMISVGVRRSRHTQKGIRENMTFSVNVPSVDIIKEADYCGTNSGPKANKLDICRFKVFYGKLKNAPLIEQCPVNLECKVMHVLDLGTHQLFVGTIEETHVSEDCLTDGKPDVNKIKPYIFVKSTVTQYQAFGEVIAQVGSPGRELKTGK